MEGGAEGELEMVLEVLTWELRRVRRQWSKWLWVGRVTCLRVMFEATVVDEL